MVKELEVATPSLSTPIRRLSGGNVQKVLVGREITSAPKVLLTAYAVRGLDIHSSYTIYNLINNQKKQNVAVVYVGEDLMCWWSCATAFWCCAAAKSAASCPAVAQTSEKSA